VQCSRDKVKQCQQVSGYYVQVKQVSIIVSFLLGDSPASEFYMPTFWNTLSVSFSHLSMKTEQSVPKRRNIKFRRRGITQKKAYNIQDKAKV